MPTQEGLRYLTTEEIIDLYAELQRLARIDPRVALDHTGNYLLPVEELESLSHEADGKDLVDAATYYLQNLILMSLFPDGNFRMALLATELFLEDNGHRFEYPVEEALSLREKLMAIKQERYREGRSGTEEVLEEISGPVNDLCRRFVEHHIDPKPPHFRVAKRKKN